VLLYTLIMADSADSVSKDADDTMRSVEEDEEGEEEQEEEDDHPPQGEPSSSKEPNPSKTITTTIGGTVAKDALCLLDGFVIPDGSGTNDADDSTERITLFIKRIPAIVGRTHVTTDKNFVGLGGGGSSKNLDKAVSRQHVRIDYRVPTSAGGCGHIQSKVGFRAEFFYNVTDDPIATSEIRMLSSTTGASTLPETGFYTLTCLGKNRVLVNGTRIDPGETVWLPSGSAVRMANYYLYFLTPTGVAGGVRKTIQIRDDIAPPADANKRRRLSLPGGVSTARPAVIGSGTGEGIVEDEEGRAAASSSNRAARSLQSEIEALSTSRLLNEMKKAQEEDIWDRRHQLIGSTLSYRAVLAAAQDTEWYQAYENGHVSRSAIMDWIAASAQFGSWVEHMLSKLEPKSYQASITKAMIKAGYTRTSSSGRYIKWIVPPPISKSGDSNSSTSSGGNHSNEDPTERPVHGGATKESLESDDDDDQSDDMGIKGENDEHDDDQNGDGDNSNNEEQDRSHDGPA
jgi:FHA domain